MWDKDAVKQLRHSLDLTQVEFAELLGCRQQTISEWEQGLYAPANAYGKLLSQLKGRAPISEYRPNLPQQSILMNAPLLKEGLEFFKESQKEVYEAQYERPFDPAID